MKLNHLDAVVLLKLLRDRDIKIIAIKYYAEAQLSKLIDAIKIAASKQTRVDK